MSESPPSAREERVEGGGSGGGLIQTMIDRPVTILSIVLLVIFLGFIAIQRLPIELTPDITTPTITVQTTWVGASPVEVESDIVDRQEEELQSIQGVVEMESTAEPNQARIILEFRVGTDIDEALVRVSNALDQVDSYPENVDNPVIFSANSSGSPLSVIIVSRKDGGSVAPYRTWMEEDVLPDFQRIPGVAFIRFFGGQDDEVQVNFQPEDLAARNLTVGQLAGALQQELSDRSSGNITIGKRRLIVRTMLAPKSVDEINDIVITGGPDGTPIRIGDVANVSLGLRKANDFALFNDDPALGMLLYKESGSNVLEVTDEIRGEVDRLNAEVFGPEGLSIQIVSDQAGYIRGSLKQVRTNLLLGSGFAVLVLLLFLGSFGASMIISLAIPLCALGTAVGMYALGRTINVVSLAGVTFAIGMVVDASIVSLENIDTWQGRVSDRRRAAYLSTREVWGALLASTATTIIVFVPVLTWTGEIGQILRDIAFAISIAVFLSFLVSVFVIPGISVWLLKKKTDKKPGPIARAGARSIDGIVNVVSFISKGWIRPVLVVSGFSAIAVFVAFMLLPKFEYLPEGNRNLVFGILLPPPGYSVDEMEKVGDFIQSQLTDNIEGDAEPQIARSFFVGSPAQVFSGAVAADPEDIPEMTALMQRNYRKVPGMIAFAQQASLFGSGIGEGRAVEIQITGQNLESLILVAQQMYGRAMGALPGSQIRPKPLLDLGAPELRIEPRRNENAQYALTADEFALTTSAYVDGAIVGEWGEEGARKVDVIVRAQSAGVDVDPRSGANVYPYSTPEALLAAPVAVGGGGVVPMSILARAYIELGPTVIQRLERQRSVILQVNPPSDIPLEAATAMIRAQVIGAMESEGAIPGDVSIGIGGTADKLAIAKKQFITILAVALMISFLLLAGLFEDFLAPLVVLVVIPFAAVGGVVALRLVDLFLKPQPLDLISAVGFLILIGVVVNNAILIVDGAIARLRDGVELNESISEAVRDRVRPIFMSTTTSLAGLSPMIFVSGSGSELYRGVGAIVLGGLALSTLLALFIVPTLFALIWRLRTAITS